MLEAQVRLNIHFLFWVLVLVGGHAFYLNAPYVNYEFLLADAGRNLAQGSPEGVANYWWKGGGSSPLGYALWAGPFAWILGAHPWVMRLPSLLGGIGILLAGWLFCRRLRSEKTALFSLTCGLTVAHPMIWIYTGRVTSDILPLGLVYLSYFFCFLGRGGMRFHMIGAMLFALAVIVKYNAFLMAPGYALLIWGSRNTENATPRSRWLALVPYGVIPLMVFGVYTFLIHRVFGIWIAGSHTWNQFSMPGSGVWGTLGFYLDHLALYAGYAALLAGFFILIPVIDVWQRFKNKSLLWIFLSALGVGAIFVSAFYRRSVGEMNFGAFDYLLGQPWVSLIRGAGFVLAFFLFVHLARETFRQNASATFVTGILLPYLLIASATRPVQRYLMFFVPLFFFYFVMSGRFRGDEKRIITLGLWTLALFVPLTATSVAYQVKQGEAAHRMVQWVMAQGYGDQTRARAIFTHVGHRFYAAPEGPKAYEILDSDNPPATYLHRETLSLFGRELKNYYLCPVEETPT